MTELKDGEARRRIRSDLETTFVVEAAAGTGKTTELVGRIITLLAQGRTTLDRIVALTFTEKAAGEMKLRLRDRLEQARRTAGEPSTTRSEARASEVVEAEPEISTAGEPSTTRSEARASEVVEAEPAMGTAGEPSTTRSEARASEVVEAEPAVRARLDAALAELETARISTIHAFAGDLLRERPVEAHVDPAFEVADDHAAVRLLEVAFDHWFQQALTDPPPGVRRALRRARAGAGGAQGPRELLLGAARTLIEHRDFPALWRRPELDREARLEQVVSSMEKLASYARSAHRSRDYLAQDLEIFARWHDALRDQEQIEGFRDYDAIEAQLRGLLRDGWRRSGRGTEYGPGLLRSEVLEERAQVRALVEEVSAACDADLAALLQRELRPVVEEYEQLKQRAGALDFIDLLLYARELLLRDTQVRREQQERFSHLFVDEFQDTDPLQADILLLLAAKDPAVARVPDIEPIAGKLFVVGDPKQAIYRFRRADVVLYERIKQQLLSHGGELLHLTTSFRATPEIQSFVNAAFAPLMDGAEDGSQPRYVPLQPSRSGTDARPSIVALSVPDPYGWRSITKKAVSESLPDAVAAYIHWLVTESGWHVREQDADVPIGARHVCLLFKRFQSFGDDVTRPYVRALEARHIAHVLVGGRSFHAREEVLGLRTALSALEWPDDELSVYATLRGPLFSFSDADLLELHERCGKLHPLRPYPDDELPPQLIEITEALRILGRLHVSRNRRPIADTVSRLLEETRAHAGIAIWPTGEQALANVLRLLDQARRYELSEATSFRSFVDWLDEQAAHGLGAEAPVIEAGSDGVRLMTVHAAKGLEFPVVILCDPTAPRVSDRPSRYIDQDRKLWAMPLAGCAPKDLTDHAEQVCAHDAAEVVRVTYVAATRARDLLVVPAVGDAPVQGWVDVLHPALYPPRGRRRAARPAPGCPAFGGDSVRRRAADADADPSGSVAPGGHSFAGSPSEYSVVWWDPRQLELGVAPRGGLRQMELLKVDEQQVASGRSVERHDAWQRRAAETRLSAAQPATASAQTVTQLSHAETGLELGLEVRRELTQRPQRSSRGPRFGTLVHTILAEISFDAPTAAIERFSQAQARVLGASVEEAADAVIAVQAALEHPRLRAAATAAQCRRETPLMLQLDDGSLVEGVVDLAYQVGASSPWVVIDFKTDLPADEAELPPAYLQQVRYYCAAIAKATGSPARGVLLGL